MDEQDLLAELRSIGRASVPPDEGAHERRAAVIEAMVEAARSAEPPHSLQMLTAEQVAPSTPMPTATPTPRPREAVLGRPRRAGLAAVVAAALVAAAAAAAVVVARNHPQAPVVAASTAAASAAGKPAEGGAFVHAQAGEVVIVGSSGLSSAPPPVASGRALGPDDRVATLTDGRATVHIGSVAVVALSPNSELALAPGAEGASSGCELRSGTAHFEVAKIGPSGSFVVKTPDAQILVHGTSFRVTVEPPTADGAPRTQVVVTDGVVSVQSPPLPEARLLAGDRWPLPSPSSSAVPSPPSPTSPSSSAGGTPSSSASASAARSDLAAQNALLADAASARRRGDAASEAKALDAFIAKYPRSPGMHEAVVNRLRSAVRSGDAGAAAREGRRYLQFFPNGPLREEALAAVNRAKP